MRRGLDDENEMEGEDLERENEERENEERERVYEFVREMDIYMMGRCRQDQRLKPLFKIDASNHLAHHTFFSNLTQHFEPSEVGMLARCLCIPLVSIRVGKIRKQENLLCPTAIRGKLNLTLLPTSDLRISFNGDDGCTERLVTLVNEPHCSDIAVDEIPSDTSGRSFLLKVPAGEVFYFWCSEKSKLLGSELLMKMKDFLQRKPSLAELTRISDSRLECFATYLGAYLGSSLSTTQAASISRSSDSSELFCRGDRPSSSSSKPLCSSNIASQSFQVGPSPRAGSFKDGSRNLSYLRSVGRDKLRKRDNPYSAGDSLPSASSVTTYASSSSSSHFQSYEIQDATKEQIFIPTSLPFMCPVSQVTSLATSFLSPYYCLCPLVPSAMQYTVSSQFPLSSTGSLTLPPLSSLLPVIGSSNVLTPPLEIPDMPKLDPLFSEPLIRFPLPRSSSQQFPTFTPLMCDPLVHIPVINVCSSGSGYLVSAGSALSTTIPPLLPRLGNPLIPDSDSVAEEGARETLRLLINSTSQTNPQLMPSDFTFSEERHGILTTGSRGLYTGMRDVGVLTNSFANLELVSFEKLIGGGDMAKRSGVGNSSEVETSGGVKDDDDSLSNLKDQYD